MNTEEKKYILPVYEVPKDLQRYQLYKWHKENPAPIMFAFKSTKEGLTTIDEVPVARSTSFSYNRYSSKGDRKITGRKYILMKSPYEVDFEDGEISSIESGYGSGFGDLWGFSYFCSFDRDEIGRLYKEEFKRVKEKYNSKPLKLYFDMSEFNTEEIAEVIAYLNKLYKKVGGDELEITECKTFEITIPKSDN